MNWVSINDGLKNMIGNAMIEVVVLCGVGEPLGLVFSEEIGIHMNNIILIIMRFRDFNFQQTVKI